MTLAELRAIAERDAASTDPRQRKAGEWAGKALAALEKKDWTAAIVALSNAIVKCPEGYAEAFSLPHISMIVSSTSKKKAASSRANGRKGGRPRKYPEGCRAHWRNARKNPNPEMNGGADHD